MTLDHIGIAVTDPEQQNLFTRLLGRPPYKTEHVPGQAVETIFYRGGGAVAVDQHSAAKVELLATDEENSPIGKFLAKRGPGLHHLAFRVEDIRAEMERLKNDGFELLQEEPTPGADNKLICFLHPKTTGGVLVELCQALSDPSHE